MASSSMLLTFSSARRRMRNRRSRRNRKRKRKRKRDESKGRLLGKADAYFSSFRRCNYPRIRAPNATPEIVYECARYSSFWDIPSAWWQASTVTMGIGVSIAVIGALTLLAAASSFLPHILRTPKHTRLLGSIHFIAATMICGGLVMYPIGWDNQEVRESCGKAANVYNLEGRFSAVSPVYRLLVHYSTRPVNRASCHNGNPTMTCAIGPRSTCYTRSPSFPRKLVSLPI
ncbi:LHFPL tetraspan subfamily member 6 protein-like isoform X2 [Vespa velutina]|uniref:LHFPL tetraspan subfamily member 6 protein-like isoform X2 n=1 Tax=Vespa velutina TaxID=202808 RepID=UPI001FB36179|nr:LHFPL tetraspan subfamily member 6 protein-like isoform X2 [Vespa velutina]